MRDCISKISLKLRYELFFFITIESIGAIIHCLISLDGIKSVLLQGFSFFLISYGVFMIFIALVKIIHE
jgi:hypothetical protein